MLKLRRSIFFAPLNLFAVIVLASIPLFGVNYSWGNWQPASCMPNHCFCEALRDGFIRQPINAYSNLAFVLVGLVMITVARDDWRRGTKNNLMQSERTYPLIFGIAIIGFLLEVCDQAVKPEHITLPSKSDHLPYTHGGKNGSMTEFLTTVNIRHMHFDGR